VALTSTSLSRLGNTILAVTLLRTGEDTFDIPHGQEQPDIARIPD
jgi:hypothetical protein